MTLPKTRSSFVSGTICRGRIPPPCRTAQGKRPTARSASVNLLRPSSTELSRYVRWRRNSFLFEPNRCNFCTRLLDFGCFHVMKAAESNSQSLIISYMTPCCCQTSQRLIASERPCNEHRPLRFHVRTAQTAIVGSWRPRSPVHSATATEPQANLRRAV